MVFSGSTFVFQWYAQSWFIVQTTDSPLALGILGGGRGIVMTLLSVYGGVLADRLDRRWLLIVSQTLSMLIYAVLSALVIMDLAELWLVFVLVLLSSAALAVDQPVRQALIPELVPRRDVPGATALVAAAQMGAFAYLPPLAGVSIDHLGTGWTFALSLIGHLGIIVAAAMMHYRGGPVRGEAARPSAWADAREGFRYSIDHRQVFWLFAITWALSGLGWPLIVTLSPLWFKNELGMSATGFTLVSSAWGTASLVASLYLAQRRQIPMMGRLFVISAFAFCGSLLLFSLTRSIPLVVLVLGPERPHVLGEHDRDDRDDPDRGAQRDPGPRDGPHDRVEVGQPAFGAAAERDRAGCRHVGHGAGHGAGLPGSLRGDGAVRAYATPHGRGGVVLKASRDGSDGG